MRAALMRKLGYYVPSPKSYRNLRVFFKDEEEKATVLLSAQESPIVNDFKSRHWILEDNKENHSVVLADAILEPSVYEYFNMHWGIGPRESNSSVIELFSTSRAYRALIIPFSLVDVPESINRYSPKFASIVSGHIILTHPSASSFSLVTYEDLRWLVRRMTTWTKEDYMEIVQAAGYPMELQGLVYAKMMYRVRDMFRALQLKTSQPFVLPNLNITTASGLVKNGKVTKEFVPGYPQRFSHGDRESPIQDGDLQRYLTIQGKTSILSSLLSEFSKKLQILTTEQAAQNYADSVKNKILDHIKNKPLEPLYQQVEAWGGPLAGLNVYAARHVSSGTYNESSATIQLVDNVSVAANLGYFFALNGIPTIRPGGGANMNITRDYTHVRPLLSIAEGTKIEWKNLIVPAFMKNLTNILKSTEDIPGKNPDDPSMQPLDAFLADLREGEVFTITDSIALSTYAQVSASFDVLMGITPLSVINSIALGADASKIILRQTSITKTADGIQVYVRDQSSKLFGATFDVNLFINLLKYRAQVQYTDLHTDAFIIDYNPTPNDSERKKNDLEYTRENLRPTLLALFGQNETEFLYSRFDHKRFDLKHELKTTESRLKVLWYRASKFTEDHLVKIQYPRDPEAPELNPADEEVVLFSNKTGTLVGLDGLDFGLEVLENILNHFTPKFQFNLDASTSPNPANVPFGKAYWTLVNSETDLSKTTEALSDVSMIQHVWGGWGMKTKDFFQIVDIVTSKFFGTSKDGIPLIEKSEFSTMSSVDFYRVTANLSILPTGLDKIKNFVLQPQAGSKVLRENKTSFWDSIGRVFSLDFTGTARSEDLALYKEYVTLLGEGDFKKGEDLYKKLCHLEYDPYEERNPDHVAGTWKNGNYYSCLNDFLSGVFDLARKYPKADKKEQARWMTKLLSFLDQNMKRSLLLKIIGEENYIFFVRVNGFRTGDEDGDLQYFSNSLGDPTKNIDYANGLFNYYAAKTRISPIELDRSQGSFR